MDLEENPLPLIPPRSSPIAWRAECPVCGWRDPQLHTVRALADAAAALHRCPTTTPREVAVARLSTELTLMAVELLIYQMVEGEATQC